MIYLLSTVVSFIAVFLKGFQHKNVIGSHLKSVFVTSMLIAAFDVVTITLIIEKGWRVAISAGIGASCGMVLSIIVHDRMYTRKK